MITAVAVLVGVAIGLVVGYIARDFLAVTEQSRAYMEGRAKGFELGQASTLAPLSELHRAMNR